MRSRMTLVPRLFSHWWEHLDRPHRLLDQNFGLALRPEQFIRDFDKMTDRMLRDFDRNLAATYYRPWADLMRDDNAGYSVVKDDKDKFAVSLDVQQFKPEEVNVKVVDNYIVIEGKHEEKKDDHGMISRHFVRKYLVPEQCDPDKASSTLSSDGVLSITVPRKPEAIEQKKEKPISIEHTGKPAVENKIEEPVKIAAEQ
ncbi:protein lethal(2)essential for life [Diachasma alloeum]|uniref:protein lethal(2)essential for life n=1 Tax=Diachasma alloeum TaxID=454923 RepID=UPI0007383E62|nr:protein lethal(2)essential for life [Diachasma alloeum]